MPELTFAQALNELRTLERQLGALLHVADVARAVQAEYAKRTALGNEIAALDAQAAKARAGVAQAEEASALALQDARDTLARARAQHDEERTAFVAAFAAQRDRAQAELAALAQRITAIQQDCTAAEERRASLALQVADAERRLAGVQTATQRLAERLTG